MAYFSNSTDGAAFEHQCSRCKLNDASCPIASVQFNYNYDAVNNKVATKILNGLVKDNGLCLMYLEIEKAWEDKPFPSTKSKCNKHIVVGSAGKKRKCYNCKHRTEAFKVGKLTHYHCMSPTYTKQYNEGIDISPWETLRVFSDTCDEHEFR